MECPSQIIDTDNVGMKNHAVVKSPVGLPNDRTTVVDAGSDPGQQEKLSFSEHGDIDAMLRTYHSI